MAYGSNRKLTVLAYLKDANFNTTADQPMVILNPGQTCVVFTSIIMNPSSQLTTAQGGIYSGASKSGSNYLSAAQLYSALNPGVRELLSPGAPPTTAVRDRHVMNNAYFSLTTPKGSAGTADVLLVGILTNDIGPYDQQVTSSSGNVLPVFSVLGYASGLNMNSATDQPINMRMGNSTAWTPSEIIYFNPSGSLTTGSVGIYTGTAKGGTIIFSVTTLSGLSTTAKYQVVGTNSTNGRTENVLYFNPTTTVSGTVDCLIMGMRPWSY